MVRVSLVLLAVGACARPMPPPALPGVDRTEAIFAAFEQMTRAPLWPGFEPQATPVAYYDGTHTWLFHHPQPPLEFRSVRPRLAVFDGRHDVMRANTAVELGGTPTATIQPPADLDTRLAGASAVHEAFHVFQGRRHPDWVANELDRFAYPDGDPAAAELRYTEDANLRRALEAYLAADISASRCAAEAALALRARRAGSLPAAAMAYERAVERSEGLAQYVEYLAFGRTPPWPDGELTPDQVRQRAYFSGQTWALLLDGFAPGWHTRFEEEKPPQALDELLRASITRGSACALPEKELRAARRQARRDVEALRARRSKRGRELGTEPGSRLVIDAGREPLWPQGFDPWKIESLPDGRLLHQQWLKLGNAAGSIEVLEHASWTESAGGMPLAGGIRRLVVPGLSAAPSVTWEGDEVRITAQGIKARLRATSATTEGGALHVKLR